MRLIVANIGETDGFKLGIQGSDGFLKVFGNVDLCIVDGRIGRVELVNHNFKRLMLRMCEPQVHALVWKMPIRLKLIDDEVTGEIADVWRQFG
jgi:hypothetical protein